MSGSACIKAENRKSLIFSEVYLNNNKAKCWLEITNICNGQQVLEKMRFYHTSRSNILPKYIIEQDGITIQSGESIIICADKNIFSRLVKNKKKVIEVPLLKNIKKGGYFILRTKNNDFRFCEGFRCGQSKESEEMKNMLGNYVIPFSKDSSSYHRVNKNNRAKFVKNHPNPGLFKRLEIEKEK